MVITLQTQLLWESNIGGDASPVDDKQNCVNDKVDWGTDCADGKGDAFVGKEVINPQPCY